MPIVPLDRRFVEWTQDEPADPEMNRLLGLAEPGLGWDELLQKWRVVILAEAGSGKTSELSERARLLSAGGKHAFSLSVSDVASDGLDNALTHTQRPQLARWREGSEEAWFFVDSVDQAKSKDIRLEVAFRRLAEGIQSAEHRAHVVLSSRVTDWERSTDLSLMKSLLGLPFQQVIPTLTPEQELVRIIRRERPADSPPAEPETIFVALMAHMDQSRVRTYSRDKGVADLDRFIEAIEAEDLWRLARRPLDLNWLVEIWQRQRRLGSLQEMIELSIEERLKEPDNNRARTDDLDHRNATSGVSRIAAAMVLSRRTTVAIPDSEAPEFSSDSPLDLAEVLPDWGSAARNRLLSRPIFDPATFGRVRFHNDNEAAIRGFLTAKWLSRLRDENLAVRDLFQLLFADSYGLQVGRPALRDAAAWLSLRDHDVAKELTNRDPVALLTRGDPASLPAHIRSGVLTAAMKLFSQDESEFPWEDNNQLRRFAQPDIGSTVVSLWRQYKASHEAAELLLRIAWLGRLKECGRMAEEAFFDARMPDTARVFAWRTLAATSTNPKLSHYARWISRNHATLPSPVLRDAVGDLFPAKIGVAGVLQIISSPRSDNDEDCLGLRWQGADLIRKLTTPEDVEQLLQGLLDHVGRGLRDYGHYQHSERDEAYFPPIVAAARQILQLSAPDSLPEIAADAILVVCNRRRHPGDLNDDFDAARRELQQTKTRRQLAFWRIAGALRASAANSRINDVWQLQYLGFTAELKEEDVDWLLADGLKGAPDDQHLSVTAALGIYRAQGQPPALLKKIKTIAKSNPAAAAFLREQLKPRQLAPGLQELDRKHKKIEQENAAAQAAAEQWWVDFFNQLRSDVARVERLRHTATPINPDLARIWQILDWASARTRYGIPNIAVIEKIAGPAVAKAAQEGMTGLWRVHAPQTRSSQGINGRNSIRTTDVMGLSGLSMEAANVPDWAGQLSPEEATKAAEYATLELNRFPPWLASLASTRPIQVRDVLLREIRAELALADLTHFHTLQMVAYAGDDITRLVVSPLLDEVEKRVPFPPGPLAHVLRIIVRGIESNDYARLSRITKKRFRKNADAVTGIQYLAALFNVDPRGANSILTANLPGFDTALHPSIVDSFLAASFNDLAPGHGRQEEIPADVLAQLVRLMFRTNVALHPTTSTGNLRPTDGSEYARSALFNRFVNAPGKVTYQALNDLQNDPTCPIAKPRLRAMAKKRAIHDANFAPWAPSEVEEFERRFEIAPRTPEDLQSLVRNRVEDMRHDLIHGDFGQGRTLKDLRDEVDVQNWIADRFRLLQGHSYSVEREPHVIQEKEPDIRIRARSTDASVAVEVKVVDTWTLKQLEDALVKQLCGQYLRARNGRHGLLLLVHQVARKKGWQDSKTRRYLRFTEVFEHLSRRAEQIRATGRDSPQPEIAVIDVSGIQSALNRSGK